MVPYLYACACFRCNKEILSDYLEIANGFNEFYSQVGPNLASEIENTNSTFNSYLTQRNEINIEFSRISEIDILKTVKRSLKSAPLQASFQTNCYNKLLNL